MHVILVGTADDHRLTPDEFVAHLDAIEAYRSAIRFPFWTNPFRSLDDALRGLRALLVALPSRAVEVEEHGVEAQALVEPPASARAEHLCGLCGETQRSRHGDMGFRLVQGLDDRRRDVLGLAPA